MDKLLQEILKNWRACHECITKAGGVSAGCAKAVLAIIVDKTLMPSVCLSKVFTKFSSPNYSTNEVCASSVDSVDVFSSATFADDLPAPPVMNLLIRSSRSMVPWVLAMLSPRLI